MDFSLAAPRSVAENPVIPPSRDNPSPTRSRQQTLLFSSTLCETRETAESSNLCWAASVDINLVAPNLEVCTESLGFESFTEKMDDVGNMTAESPNSRPLVTALTYSAASRSRMIVKRRRRKDAGLFPPMLTSLDQSGRPRFALMRERRGGRLRIYTVQNDVPGMVRCYGADGELKMEFSVL